MTPETVTYILPRQFAAAILISLSLLMLVVRLVQKGKLDIAYCWLWLGIGLGSILVVVRYDWLNALSGFIGAMTNTTTLFLLAIVVILLLCLQFSMVVSAHRRQIKQLAQQVALLNATRPAPTPDEAKHSADHRAPAP